MVEEIKRYGPPVGLFLYLVLAAVLWNHEQRALTDARAEAEAYRLKMHGQIVADANTKADLKATADKLLAENADLRTAYERAKAAAPGAAPIAAAHLDTGLLPVVRPEPARQAPPDPPGKEATGLPNPVASVCVLHDTDQASIDVKVLLLQAKQGTYLIAGEAETYREPEHARIVAGPFTASLSDAAALEPTPQPRWGAMLTGLCTREGCGLGAAVLLPPATFFGLRWEAQAGVYTGPALGVAGGVGARW